MHTENKINDKRRTPPPARRDSRSALYAAKPKGARLSPPSKRAPTSQGTKSKSIMKDPAPLLINRALPIKKSPGSKIKTAPTHYKKGKQGYGANRKAQLEYSDLQPWERQPDEGPEAYAQFTVYRDMAPEVRGYAKVAAIVHMSKTVCTRHGATHYWVERAAAWDFHLERARLSATETYQIEMAARHAMLAKGMLDKLTERLKKVNLNTLGPKEIAQWLDVGVKVERLSRGLRPEETAGTVVNINNNIKGLSDQELLTELAKEGIRQGSAANKVINALPA